MRAAEKASWCGAALFSGDALDPTSLASLPAFFSLACLLETAAFLFVPSLFLSDDSLLFPLSLPSLLSLLSLLFLPSLSFISLSLLSFAPFESLETEFEGLGLDPAGAFPAPSLLWDATMSSAFLSVFWHEARVARVIVATAANWMVFMAKSSRAANDANWL
ncbi:hypothetical protein GQ54DRAFT_46673 [Martensiomyces pterosporus]|nr:hypothetical protein GQ54DRAFT_46673 [Martensiomyces pterosporus]